MSRKPKLPKPVPSIIRKYVRPPHRIGADVQADMAFFDRLRQQWGRRVLNSVEREAADILTEAGILTEADVYFTDTVEIRGEKHTRHFRGLDRLAEHRGHEVGSLIWYAAKIIEHVAAARHAIAAGNPDQIVNETWRAAVVYVQAAILTAYGPALDTGIKQRAVLDRTREEANTRSKARAGAEHERLVVEAQRVWRDHPHLSASACAAAVINRLELRAKRDTVRRIIAKACPKKVGTSG